MAPLVSEDFSISFVRFQFGVVGVARRWLGNRCFGRRPPSGYVVGIPPVPAAPPPAPRSRRPSAASDPVSDGDDHQCLAHMVCMNLPTGTMSLSNRECVEPFDSEVRLLLPDLLAYHLPDTYDLSGIKLRDVHRDVYAKLRGSLMCANVGCANMGGAGPQWGFPLSPPYSVFSRSAR